MKPILLIFLSLWALKGSGQDAEFYEEKADEKIEAKNYERALVFIDKAIELNDTNQWLLITRSEIVYHLAGPKEAIKVINAAIELDPNNPEPYNRASSFYESIQRINVAINMLDSAIYHAEDDSAKFVYLANRGSMKCKSHDLIGARIDLEMVLAFTPNDLVVLNNIAPVYRQLGLTDKAIECMKKAIEIDKTFIGPYNNLGFIYSSIDSFDQSINYFNKVLAIDPDEPLAYNNRGYSYYRLGEYRKAMKDIKKSIDMYSSNSYAYRNLALVYIAQNRMQDACEALNTALSYGFTKLYGPEVKELFDKYCQRH